MKLLIQYLDMGSEFVMKKINKTTKSFSRRRGNITIIHDDKEPLDVPALEDRINMRCFGYKALASRDNRLRVFRILNVDTPTPVEIWNDSNHVFFNPVNLDFWIDKDGNMRDRSHVVVFRGPSMGHVEA
jgi:hypothetical protein